MHVCVFGMLPQWQADHACGISYFTHLWSGHTRQLIGFTVRGAAFSVWVWLRAALWITGADRSLIGLHCRWELRCRQEWAERKITSFISFFSLKPPGRAQFSIRAYDLGDTGRVEHSISIYKWETWGLVRGPWSKVPLEPGLFVSKFLGFHHIVFLPKKALPPHSTWKL